MIPQRACVMGKNKAATTFMMRISSQMKMYHPFFML
jgi:hypothetical protein